MSNKVFSGDLLKVLLALKDSIMKDIHCSELAVIKEVFTDNCNCSLISNPNIKINAYRVKGTRCKVGDVVLVAFSDNDFRSNLVKKDNNTKLQTIDSVVKHQLDYGIIVSNLTIGFGGGTRVSFVDNKTIRTLLSSLDMNRLTNEQLNELIDNGQITPNSLYMTIDESEDPAKADVDASNLTEANVLSWQNKCGFERVETIYDMTGDASLNWGKPDGLPDGVYSRDVSKYHALRVYVTTETAVMTASLQSVFSLYVDLTILVGDEQLYSGISTSNSRYGVVNTPAQTELRSALIFVPPTKNSIQVYLRNNYVNNTQFTTGYHVIKIEGVY